MQRTSNARKAAKFFASTISWQFIGLARTPASSSFNIATQKPHNSAFADGIMEFVMECSRYGGRCSFIGIEERERQESTTVEWGRPSNANFKSTPNNSLTYGFSSSRLAHRNNAVTVHATFTPPSDHWNSNVTPARSVPGKVRWPNLLTCSQSIIPVPSRESKYFAKCDKFAPTMSVPGRKLSLSLERAGARVTSHGSSVDGVGR